MQGEDSEAPRLTPGEGWESIHATLDRSRSSMYVAGWQPIMLMWGAICALGYISMYAVWNLVPEFAEDYPWFPAILWGFWGLVGMVASSLIGHRASKRNASGAAARAAGLKVFAFWLSVVVAAFLVPLAAGMWDVDMSAEANGRAIAGVAIGIIALGYVLFGVLHHGAIALVGLGIAAAYYGPTHLAGDDAPVASAILILAVVGVAWAWLRRSGAA